MSDPSVWSFDNNSLPTLHGGKMGFLFSNELCESLGLQPS